MNAGMRHSVQTPDDTTEKAPRGSALKAQFALPHGLLGRPVGWVLAKTGEYSGMTSTTLNLLAVKSDEWVLEVGFGPGEAVRLLTERQPTSHVYGVDPSPVMLARARRRNRRGLREADVDLRLGTAEHLPWPDDTFNAVFAINTAQLWTPLRAGVTEVRRVLAPGGRVLLALHQRCVNRNGGSVCARDLQPQLVEALTAAGFTDVVAESRTGKGGPAVYVTGWASSPTRV